MSEKSVDLSPFIFFHHTYLPADYNIENVFDIFPLRHTSFLHKLYDKIVRKFHTNRESCMEIEF